jgi:gas vesicle protein
MKFILGLITGAALGAAGAVIYAGRSGQDLRETYETVKSDIDKRDFDALGSRLEARLAEIQSQIEMRFSEVREKATAAIDDAREAADTATEQASGAVEAAADAVESASQAAEDQAGA